MVDLTIHKGTLEGKLCLKSFFTEKSKSMYEPMTAAMFVGQLSIDQRLWQTNPMLILLQPQLGTVNRVRYVDRSSSILLYSRG